MRDQHNASSRYSTEDPKYRGESSVVVLVDFHNIFFNRSLSSQDAYEWLPIRLEEFISDAVQAAPDTGRLRIRLYGSWMENGVLTPEASKVQQAIASMKAFPRSSNNRILHGEIELSLSLAEFPDIRLHTFVKRQQGLSRAKIAKSKFPQHCKDDKRNCPIRCFQDFASKRNRKCLVEGCMVTNSDAFETVTQKMVDTFLACDLSALARRQHAALVIVSGDIDLMPAIVTAASLQGPAIKLITTSSLNSLNPYDNMLESLGVTIAHRKST